MDGAIEDYDQAIRHSPDYAIAFNNRGYAREFNGDLDGALADYNQAIRLQPDNAVAIKNRKTVRKALAKRSKS